MLVRFQGGNARGLDLEVSEPLSDEAMMLGDRYYLSDDYEDGLRLYKVWDGRGPKVTSDKTLNLNAQQGKKFKHVPNW